MPEIWDDDYEEPRIPQQSAESNLVKDLRKMLREEKARTKTLSEELGTLKPALRKTSVSTLLSDKFKVNPKIAALIPDSVEATEDGIKAWLDEFGDVFGVTSAPAEDGKEAPAYGTPPRVEVTPDAQAQWARIQSQESQAGTSQPDQETAQMAFIQAAAKAANGDSEKYFSILRGEEPLPTS